MTTKDYSTKQEKAIANYLNWYTVKASGATAFDKGDIKSDDWLVEAKTHVKESDILFNYKVWEQIQELAMIAHKKPVLITDNGTQLLDNTWCLISSFLVPFHCKKFKLDDSLVKHVNKATIKCSNDILMKCYAGKLPEDIGIVEWNNTKVAIMPISHFKQGVLELK